MGEISSYSVLGIVEPGVEKYLCVIKVKSAVIYFFKVTYISNESERTGGRVPLAFTLNFCWNPKEEYYLNYALGQSLHCFSQLAVSLRRGDC